ncbi:MAG: hypothetical protein ABL958_21400 [Bdellovibrionia bacterium]
MRNFFLVFALFAPSTSWSYANFIGYGYTSCATCHYNSFGNGPLNDYGRALWATEIAGRAFHGSNVDEESLGNQSGFLGSMKLPEFWKPSIGFRGLNYMSNVGGSSSQSRFIVMQGDFTNVLAFGSREDLAIVFNVGYIPKPQSAVNSNNPKLTSNWISREHYIRYSISRPLRIYLGMMDKVYGLRIPDHNAFSREQTALAQNDQAHGVIVGLSYDKFELGVGGFAGNLYQDEALRQIGASGMFEVELAEKWRLGASALSSGNQYVALNMAALHTRIGVGKGSSIMTELGAINRKPKNNSEASLAAYALMQNMLRIGRGMHWLTTFEYYTSDINKLKTKQMRFTPGFQWFPAQRIEMRVEAMNSRSYDPDNAQKDVWDLLGQIHLYF